MILINLKICDELPIVAIAFGALMSCLNISYKRPIHKGSRKRKDKHHGQFQISWKGDVKMGILTALLMAGTGVYRV